MFSEPGNEADIDGWCICVVAGIDPMSKRTWGVAVGLAAAFALGWFGAEVRNVDKLSPGEVVAARWHKGVFTFMRNARSNELVNPATILANEGWGLDLDSVPLAALYDGLPSAWKKQIVFDLPAAHALALASAATAYFPQDREHLLIFVECVQKVQSQGGSVHACTTEHPGWRGNARGLPAAPTPGASSAASPPAR